VKNLITTSRGFTDDKYITCYRMSWKVKDSDCAQCNVPCLRRELLRLAEGRLAGR